METRVSSGCIGLRVWELTGWLLAINEVLSLFHRFAIGATIGCHSPISFEDLKPSTLHPKHKV